MLGRASARLDAGAAPRRASTFVSAAASFAAPKIMRAMPSAKNFFVMNQCIANIGRQAETICVPRKALTRARLALP
jgi:hypothetical protein